MTRKEAKKMAQSRDCSCVKGKDRDTNYDECIDKVFDWHERVVKKLDIHDVVADLKRYSTIVVDPPWRYGKWGKASKPNYEGHIPKESDLPYDWMSVDEIKALPVGSIANKNCELYLWTTQKYLPDAFEVIKVWGFKYCQTLTWCKKPMGKGQGGIYCPTTEFLILARRGKMPKVERVDTTWWQVSRAWKTHSKKPEFFQDLIEQVSEAPRLEMFARREREGWDVFGNEVNNSINLELYRSNGI